MLPYGVPFDSLPFLYLTPTQFFDLKCIPGNQPYFCPWFFIPRRGVLKGTPFGVPIWDSFGFISSLPTFFFDLILQGVSCHFRPAKFLIPRRGDPERYPVWGTNLRLFRIYIFPTNFFFFLLLQAVPCHFGPAKFFISTDGWMDGRTDGWMDGWSTQKSCFLAISQKIPFFFLNVFGPLRRLFKTSFVKNPKILIFFFM